MSDPKTKSEEAYQTILRTQELNRRIQEMGCGIKPRLKVKFSIEANNKIMDVNRDLNLTDDEWNKLSDVEKTSLVGDWAIENVEFWYKEIT